MKKTPFNSTRYIRNLVAFYEQREAQKRSFQLHTVH